MKRIQNILKTKALKTIVPMFMVIVLGAVFLGKVASAATVTTTTTAANAASRDSAVKEPVILVYHSVEPKTDKKQTRLQKQYHVFPETFRAQMQYLKDNGYVPIPMKMYQRYLEQGIEIPKKSVVLTFDDGWKNQYQYAYPILKEFGYPATFYIITSAVGGVSYVTWDEIKEMMQSGMDIQSHTKTHANLAKVDPKKALEELVDSKKVLEEKLGRKITMVAYPYYSQNEAVHALVEQAGYKLARGGWAKAKNSTDTRFMLKSQESVNSKNPFSSKADQ